MKRRICICERQDLSLEASAQVNVLLGFCHCTDVWSLKAGLYAKRHEATQTRLKPAAYGTCLLLAGDL